MRKILILLFVQLVLFPVQGQNKELPRRDWQGKFSNKAVIYLSGDGGFNNFSNKLCAALSEAGYPVTAINSREYFWVKKDPAQTAAEIAALIDKSFSKNLNQQLIFVGYSFGADVLPFILNRLPEKIKHRIKTALYLSPAGSTDFEIHLSDMAGRSRVRSMDVASEIVELSTVKSIIVLNGEDDSFPIKKINPAHTTAEMLPGNHHFDESFELLINTMLKYF